MRDAMTPRERWLAAVRMLPVDRLPFWPKIFGDYLNVHRRAGLESLEALHAYIGFDRHEGVDNGLTATRTVTSVTERRDGEMLIHTFAAPRGNLVMEERWDAGSQSWHPTRFPVATRDDIRILIDVYRDTRWSLDEERLAQAATRKAEIGERAVTNTGVGTSPFMWWLQYLAGVENAHLLLYDEPEAVSELFQAMHDELRQRVVLIAERHPADLIYLIENTSTSLLSPAQYRAHNLPHLHAYVDILNSHDRLTVLHMCGLLQGLLPDLATLPAQAFEAFTSPPVGNTTLADGRAACPDTCLIGGTNAALWTQPADAIIAEMAAHLDALPHTRGLVVTSAGVMPPLATPETIHTVAEWVRGYGVRN
jgi:uroporphyrinogen-III decarboxylase